MSCTESDSDRRYSNEEEPCSPMKATGNRGAGKDVVVVTIHSNDDKLVKETKLKYAH